MKKKRKKLSLLVVAIGSSPMKTSATLGMMSVMLPMFFLAMYQKNGQPAEKILRYYLQARFIRPKVRPYQTRNYYALLMKGDDTHDSVSEKE